MSLTPEQLLPAVLDGDEAAAMSLVALLHPRLLRVIRRLLARGPELEEALQDTFLHLFRTLPEFRGQAPFSAWATRIAVNCALMRLRRRRRKPEAPISELLPRFDAEGSFEDYVQDWSPTAEALAEAGQLRGQLWEALDRLPEDWRAVFVLAVDEEMSMAEISLVLGISVPNVKTRLHRARQALREQLAAHLKGATP
jgi:RNA polymerase sigma-70 factor, ECF subfamily